MGPNFILHTAYIPNSCEGSIAVGAFVRYESDFKRNVIHSRRLPSAHLLTGTAHLDPFNSGLAGITSVLCDHSVIQLWHHSRALSQTLESVFPYRQWKIIPKCQQNQYQKPWIPEIVTLPSIPRMQSTVFLMSKSN